MQIKRYKTDSSSTKKKSRLYLKLILLAGVFLIFTGGILYILIFTQIFRFNRILINGIEDVKKVEIKRITDDILNKKFFNKIPKNNLILLPKQEIINCILENYPDIKEVGITESFEDNTLIINIKEREPSAIWCQVLSTEPAVISSTTDSIIENEENLEDLPEVESCFYIDKTGFIFGTAPIMSGGAVPTVYEEKMQSLNIRDTINNPQALEFILTTRKELALANLKLTDFVIKSQSFGDLKILIPEGWFIYLNTDYSAANQINALSRVLEEEIKNNRSRLEYIDLRVAGRAYYKLKTP